MKDFCLLFLFSLLSSSLGIESLDTNSAKCGISPNLEHYKEKLSDPDYHPGIERILGGKLSKNLDWPWLVHISFFDEELGVDDFCTGSLIHPQWVMTASHCNIEPSTSVVQYGDVNLKKASTVKIIETRPHDVPVKIGYDIQLVKLEKPLELGDRVGLICLPTEPLNRTVSALDVAAGWGMIHGNVDHTDNLHEDVIPIRDNEYCEGELENEDICAGGGSHSVTSGDSGGPLMQIVGDKWVLHGVTSRGIPTEARDIFTDVYTFCDWIKETTDNEVNCD